MSWSPGPAQTLRQPSLRHVPFREAKRYLDGVGPTDDWSDDAHPTQLPAASHLFTKSEFFRRALPRDTVDTLVGNLARDLAPGQSREVAFVPWGGAYNRVPTDATAVAHRHELYLIQHLLFADPHVGATGRASGQEWLARSWELVHRWGSGGVYPNFPDPDIQDWSHAYYGENYDRLRRIKARYDSDGWFRLYQSIGT